MCFQSAAAHTVNTGPLGVLETGYARFYFFSVDTDRFTPSSKGRAASHRHFLGQLLQEVPEQEAGALEG